MSHTSRVDPCCTAACITSLNMITCALSRDIQVPVERFSCSKKAKVKLSMSLTN
jgi:hypothetical protein